MVHSYAVKISTTKLTYVQKLACGTVIALCPLLSSTNLEIFQENMKSLGCFIDIILHETKITYEKTSRLQYKGVVYQNILGYNRSWATWLWNYKIFCRCWRAVKVYSVWSIVEVVLFGPHVWFSLSFHSWLLHFYCLHIGLLESFRRTMILAVWAVRVVGIILMKINSSFYFGTGFTFFCSDSCVVGGLWLVCNWTGLTFFCSDSCVLITWRCIVVGGFW